MTIKYLLELQNILMPAPSIGTTNKDFQLFLGRQIYFIGLKVYSTIVPLLFTTFVIGTIQLDDTIGQTKGALKSVIKDLNLKKSLKGTCESNHLALKTMIYEATTFCSSNTPKALKHGLMPHNYYNCLINGKSENSSKTRTFSVSVPYKVGGNRYILPYSNSSRVTKTRRWNWGANSKTRTTSYRYSGYRVHQTPYTIFYRRQSRSVNYPICKLNIKVSLEAIDPIDEGAMDDPDSPDNWILFSKSNSLDDFMIQDTSQYSTWEQLENLHYFDSDLDSSHLDQCDLKKQQLTQGSSAPIRHEGLIRHLHCLTSDDGYELWGVWPYALAPNI